MSEKYCSTENCDEKHYAKSLCKKCHNKALPKGYTSWLNMKSRCFNPKHPHFTNYGGRGITVCDRYKNSFSEFSSDLGKRPAGFSIDRINNDAGYTCGKCEHCKQNGWLFNLRWSDRATQQRNTRSNVVLEFNGRSQCITDWAIELGINRYAIYARIKNGWTINRALTTPVRVQTTHIQRP